MKFRVFSPVLAASVAVTLGAAACGSSSSVSSSVVSKVKASSSAAKAKIESSSSGAKAKIESSASAASSKAESSAKEAKAKYKPGEFCSSTSSSAYKAQNMVCVNGHLKSTSTSKSSTST